MINKSKLIEAGAALMMLVASGASLSSCGPAAFDLSYWCPSLDNDVMAEIVDDFKADNPDYAGKNIGLLANYSEGETYSALHKDLGAAADVILMVDDNIRAGVKAQELQPLPVNDRNAAITSDGNDAVASLSIDGTMYGYPYRNDNAPMMIYDKTVFPDPTKLNKIEDVLSACKTANKKFYLDLGNGWYNPFVLWAGGGTFTVDGGSIVTDIAGTKNASCAVAAQAVYDLYGQYKDIWVNNSTTGTIESGFEDKSIGVAFIWNDLKTLLGKNANVTVTTWPTLHIGSNDIKLECFQSYKAVVVKAELADDRLALAEAFAQYCASEKAQTRRVKELSYGPSNLKVQATDEAKAIPWVEAISSMTLSGLTHPQAPNTTSDFWTPMANFGGLITAQKTWGDYKTAARALVGLVSNTGWKKAA